MTIFARNTYIITLLPMVGNKIRKLKKIRIHREGTDTLIYSLIALVVITAALWYGFDTKWPAGIFFVIAAVVYLIVLNFYQCPVRYLNVEDTSGLVVAPADGKIVVIEEVEENEYFHEPFQCTCQLVPGRRQGKVRETSEWQLSQGMVAKGK